MDINKLVLQEHTFGRNDFEDHFNTDRHRIHKRVLPLDKHGDPDYFAKRRIPNVTRINRNFHQSVKQMQIHDKDSLGKNNIVGRVLHGTKYPIIIKHENPDKTNPDKNPAKTYEKILIRNKSYNDQVPMIEKIHEAEKTKKKAAEKKAAEKKAAEKKEPAAVIPEKSKDSKPISTKHKIIGAATLGTLATGGLLRHKIMEHPKTALAAGTVGALGAGYAYLKSRKKNK